MEIRPYEPADQAALWECKRAFETGLGTGTGDAEKAGKYEAKITEEYRAEWLAWVDRCRESDERCVTVAALDEDEEATALDEDEEATALDEDEEATALDEDGEGADGTSADDEGTSGVVGYVFVLPETMKFVWDAAVVNEVYVDPAHRGTGVADDLMDAALAFARDQDLPLDRVVLDVDRANERAQAFYARHGFEHWGELVARDL